MRRSLLFFVWSACLMLLILIAFPQVMRYMGAVPVCACEKGKPCICKQECHCPCCPCDCCPEKGK